MQTWEVTKMVTNNNLKELAYYEYNISGEHFVKMFVKHSTGDKQRALSMANHIWSKFTGYNHNIVTTWANCDTENRKILVKVINEGYK